MLIKKWWLGRLALCTRSRSDDHVRSTGVQLALLLVLLAACGFPRPPSLNEDAGADGPGGCARDEDCGSNTPFCVDTVCSVCKSSASCTAARPVCDMTSHDCRACVSDRECDSGACDLAAGTCVDQGAILYASPGGTTADPCARLLPCSLDKASSAVDAGHPYIVMLPGTHIANAAFVGQKATICGDGATLNARILADNGSSVRIRDLKMTATGSATVVSLGRIDRISYHDSEVDLDNVTLDLTVGGPYSISGAPTLFIRRSTILHGFTSVEGNITVDESTFVASSIAITLRDDDSAKITNSVFVAQPGANVLYIADLTNTNPVGGALVANNTFEGGDISCEGDAAIQKQRQFESNIFSNVTGLNVLPGCFYNYNLFDPAADVGGTGNTTGRPLFVDATNGDFHLSAGSPAIDAASPAPREPNTHDHDGRPRPQGRRSDIGAFEYAP